MGSYFLFISHLMELNWIFQFELYSFITPMWALNVVVKYKTDTPVVYVSILALLLHCHDYYRISIDVMIWNCESCKFVLLQYFLEYFFLCISICISFKINMLVSTENNSAGSFVWNYVTHRPAFNRIAIIVVFYLSCFATLSLSSWMLQNGKQNANYYCNHFLIRSEI